ncbi:uncharacterized protein LOC111595412 [Drosophila hydei]|uniref:Uncharacterized protein LOC111595412 n=1 Tax=Drosophila hydei TaxID=7224 RepID=A0A6J1LGX7_DROHY|nr:uncharacterized protein LOC111595412 [Drosophila hydei]
MQLKAKQTLLLAIVTWHIFVVQTRLADDRVVFPNDNDESTTYTYTFSISTNSSNISSTTELPLGNSTSVGNTTLAINSTLAGNCSSLDELQPTTELPTVDNRILVDSLPVCPPGQSLRAGRCRKSA